jgi:hypothetical protein
MNKPKISVTQLVIEELRRDSTPRTCAQILAAIIENTGITPNKNSISSAVQTLRNHPDYSLRQCGPQNAQKYWFASEGGLINEFDRLLMQCRRERETA